MNTLQPEHIVIIGGGFSGAMTAVNLARLSEIPLNLTVIHDGGPVGRGVAYAPRRPEYLLNVASRNMSAFPDEPEHFVQWLRTRPEFEAVSDTDLRERFMPREIFGDYVRSIVMHHLEGRVSKTPVSSKFVGGEAVDIEPGVARCVVRLADGSSLESDRVVLATGNETPAPLPGADALEGHPAWVGNPWQAWEHRLPQNRGSIVILGTGLTAVDAIVTLRAKDWTGNIDAVSRHGWFPHAHFRASEHVEFPAADIDPAVLGLARLVTLVERHCAILQKRNLNTAITWINFGRTRSASGATSAVTNGSLSRRITPRAGTCSDIGSPRTFTRRSRVHSSLGNCKCMRAAS